MSIWNKQIGHYWKQFSHLILLFHLQLLIHRAVTCLKPSFLSLFSLLQSLSARHSYLPIVSLAPLTPCRFETNATLSLSTLVPISSICPSGALFRSGGRPGVPAAPSGGDGEAAHVWWRQCARRGDGGNLLADVGRTRRRHTGTSPTLTVGSYSTAAAAATGNHCFYKSCDVNGVACSNEPTEN